MSNIKPPSDNIEFHRCKNYPLYFFKNYLKLQGFSEFNPNQLQTHALETITKFPKTIIKKNRQIGMSTFYEAYCIWRLMFHSGEVSMYMVFNHENLTHISYKFRRSLENTLLYWNSVNYNTIGYTYDSIENIKLNNNSQLVFVTPKRGIGYQVTGVLILDEANFYDFVYLIVPLTMTAKTIISSSSPPSEEWIYDTDFKNLYYKNINEKINPTMKAIDLSSMKYKYGQGW